MAFNLKKKAKDIQDFASRVYDQANVFDNGLSYSTRQVSGPQRNVWQQLGNAAAQTGKAAARYPAQLANTGIAGAAGAAGLARVAVADLTNNPLARSNAIQQTDSMLNRQLAGNSGILGAGTFFKNRTEAQNIGTADLTKKIVGKGVEGATYTLNPMAGSLRSVAAKNAAIGIAGTAGGQLADEGKINARDVLVGGAVSAAIPLAARGVQAAVRRTPTPVKTVEPVPVAKTPTPQLPTAPLLPEPTVQPKLPTAPLLPENTPVPNVRPNAGKTAAQLGQATRKRGEDFAESKIPIRKKVRDFIAENLTDDTRYLQEKDRAAAKANGQKVRNVPANQRLDPSYQAYRNVDSAAEQITKDLGIDAIGKRMGTGKRYDEYTTYATYRAGLARAKLEARAGDSLPEVYARFTGGRNLADDGQAIAALKPKRQEELAGIFTDENAIYNRLLREMGDNPNFKMSREDAERIIATNPDYLPLRRVQSEDKIRFNRTPSPGSMQGKNVQDIGKGSFQKPIEDRFTQLRDAATENLRRDRGNEFMKVLIDRNPESVRRIVSAEELNAKDAAKVTMKELGQAGKATAKELSRDKKTLRIVQSEIDKLNKQGLNASLKVNREGPANVNVKGLGGKPVRSSKAPTKMERKIMLTNNLADATKKIVGKRITDDVKALAALKKATGLTDNRLEYLLKTTFEPETMQPKVGTRDTKTLVQSLVNQKQSDVERILNKIDTREPKAAALKQQIEQLLQQADDLKFNKAGIKDSGILDAIRQNSESNYKRFVRDGQEELYEIVEPRLARALDTMRGAELSRASQVLGVPGRVFKFFTTGPGNVIVFTAVAITRDVASTVIFGKAPFRATFDPRSYVDAFAAMAKKGPMWEELARSGVGGIRVESERANKLVSSEVARASGLGKINAYRRNPGQGLRDVEELDAAFERFTRTRFASARYRQLKARKASEAEARAGAAEEFREAAINFGRSGKVVRELNQYATYLNPAVQAGNSVRRRFLESPLGFTFRMALATSMVGGVYAYNESNSKRKKIWDKISPDDKDKNLILVHDDAEFNEDTGVVTGITKIPLPQEYYVMSRGIQELFKDADDRQYGSLIGNGIATLTGLDATSFSKAFAQVLPTTAKPFIEGVANYSFFKDDKLVPDYIANEANGDKSKEVTKQTSGTAKFINEASGNRVSPIEADNYISGFFGGASKEVSAFSDKVLNKAGAITDDQVTDPKTFDTLKRRFAQSYGKTEATKFFESLEKTRSGIKDIDDREAFDAIHAKDPNPGMLDSAEKAQMYLNRPAVLAADRKLDEFNRKQGKPGNPLFDLTSEEMKKVLTYRQAKLLNAGKQTYDKNGQPLFTALGLDGAWYDQFKTAESNFYTKLKADNPDKGGDSGTIKTFSGATKQEDAAVQALTDQYFALPEGSAERKAFLAANPSITESWKKADAFTNQERAALGLTPISKSDYEKRQEARLARGGGSGGGRGGTRKPGTGRIRIARASKVRKVRSAGSTKKIKTTKPKITKVKIAKAKPVRINRA